VHLNARQIAVFHLLSQGCATKTIARRLGLPVGTVKVHLVRIYRVLGAHNRVEAIPLPTRDGHLSGTAARRRQATRSPATSWVKVSKNARPDSANFFVVQCSPFGIYPP